MSKLTLVQFQSTDKLKLPGLLYEPGKKSSKVLINIHGNGSASVFYSTKSNLFGRELNKLGISFFTFNNRGAHYIKKLYRAGDDKDEHVKLGTAYEKIKDCIKDIDGAVKFLKARGYKTLYMIGFSSGANKICVYNYYKPRNDFAKFILAGGSDDTGILYDWMGPRKFKLALKKCREQIKAGKSEKLIPKYLLDYILSYQSLYDTINPDGDYNVFPFNEVMNNLKLSKKKLFRELRSIKKPTLLIYGENDEYCYGNVGKCVDAIRDAVKGKLHFDFTVIKGADHGFHPKEEELVRTVCEWLVN